MYLNDLKYLENKRKGGHDRSDHRNQKMYNTEYTQRKTRNRID